MRTGLAALLLSRRERRFLVRGMLGSAVVAGLGVLGWLSPLSPGPLLRAGDLAAEGRLDEAVALYEHTAERHWLAPIRADAAFAAASLASVDEQEPQRAVLLLRGFVAAHPDDQRVAEAWERLATLYLLFQHDPVRAAEAWQQAALAAPQDPRAGRWLLDAGLALADASLVERAEAVLELARAYPEQAGPAALTLGRLALKTDAGRAYRYFSEAAASSLGPAERELARAGMDSALEAMDRQMPALAEALPANGEDSGASLRRAGRAARSRR